MHDSAYRIGELVMRTYCDLPNAKILEVGSLNVNGCLRDAADPTTQYVGLDLEDGPSVDFVITPGAAFPVEDDSFDLVMASSVFEHDPRFWETFVRMCRAARVGGHIYVNAPSNGTVHRYPMDCWRFYPDAGLALVEHARSEGLEIDLIESFIGNRHSDVWNDFVAVFRKGPSHEPLNTAFVYHRYPSLNARTWQSRAVYNESDSTEDMVLISELRAQCGSLAPQGRELEQARAALAEEQAHCIALAEEMERLSLSYSETQEHQRQTQADNEHLLNQVAILENDLRQRQIEVSQTSTRVEELTAERDRIQSDVDEMQEHQRKTRVDNERLLNQVVSLESNLRQRQEEISQAWARVQELTTERDRIESDLSEARMTQGRLEAKLSNSEGWVFDLAGERRTLQQRLEVLQIELEKARRTTGRLESVVKLRQHQLHQHTEANHQIGAGMVQLRDLDMSPESLHEESERLHEEWRRDGHPLADMASMVQTMAQSMLALARQKSSLHNDVEMLMERLEVREQSKMTESTMASLRADALEYHKKAAQALEKLESLQAEHKQQARLLRSLEERIAQKDRDIDWLRRLYHLLDTGESGWKALLPPQTRKQRISTILQRKGVFDSEAYLNRHPDVAEAGMDPLRHYILHGMSEGRPKGS